MFPGCPSLYTTQGQSDIAVPSLSTWRAVSLLLGGLRREKTTLLRDTSSCSAWERHRWCIFSAILRLGSAPLFFAEEERWRLSRAWNASGLCFIPSLILFAFFALTPSLGVVMLRPGSLCRRFSFTAGVRSLPRVIAADGGILPFSGPLGLGRRGRVSRSRRRPGERFRGRTIEMRRHPW